MSRTVDEKLDQVHREVVKARQALEWPRDKVKAIDRLCDAVVDLTILVAAQQQQIASLGWELGHLREGTLP